MCGSLLQFWGFVSDPKLSRRYFVSGTVQGVGFRYFTQNAARKLRLGGYVKNLADGRVEVFATGTAAQLEELRRALRRGPAFSSVSEVHEEVAELDAQFENSFVITSGY
jgi:acylphosphatase